MGQERRARRRTPQACSTASWGVEDDHDAPRIEGLLAPNGADRPAATVDVTPDDSSGTLRLLPASQELRVQTA